MDIPAQPLEGQRPIVKRKYRKRGPDRELSAEQQSHNLAARITLVLLDELEPWIGPETPSWPTAIERAEKRIERLLTEAHVSGG